MAFGGFQGSSEAQPMAEINTTPFVDVMLVLLIIFIITAPLLTHSIRIDLPQARSQASPEKPQTITLAIDARGAMFWEGEAVAAQALAARLAEAAAKQPQPELHLRVDRDTRYQVLAELMAQARLAGIARIGFVTDPSAPAASSSASSSASPVGPTPPAGKRN